MADTSAETILIVDDEETVRRTFRDWLTGAGLSTRILTAADAEAALQLANENPIDLAILDWALGAGDDGLQLLQDLYAFHPDVVAIMITGYANQATPLDAMRMGVRDYLDKNQDLSRETFLNAVRKQLDLIRPAKQSRRLHRSLVVFRDAMQKIVPLAQSMSVLQEAVPLPDAIRALTRFLQQMTKARDGVLLVRHYDADREPAETCRVYDAQGQPLETTCVPFSRSLAGSVSGLQQAAVLNDLTQTSGAELQPFEKGRRSLLAVPMAVAPGVQVVLELFDPASGKFSDDDARLVQTAADLGAEMLRQALGHRHMQQVLLDAVGSALQASESMAASLTGSVSPAIESPPPSEVMDHLRRGFAPSDGPQAEACLRLAEAIRVLAKRHGADAVEHCLRLVESLKTLLDKSAG